MKLGENADGANFRVSLGERELTNIDTEACFLPEASSKQSKERRQQQSRPVLLPLGVGRHMLITSQMGTSDGNLA